MLVAISGEARRQRKTTLGEAAANCTLVQTDGSTIEHSRFGLNYLRSTTR
jgi:hypothetical protein